MSRHLLVAVSALFCSLVFLSPSIAQGLRPPPADDRASAERRLEDLQKQVEALTKELEGLRKGVGSKLDASNMAEAAFRQMDRNADGLLDYDEMSDILKAEFKKWDTNKDGSIDLNEFKAYFKAKLAEQEARTKEPTPAEKTETRAFSLKFSNASEVAKVLQELFGTGEKRLRLTVDDKANKIFATGSALDLITVQTLLTKLDKAPEQPKTGEKTSWKIFSLKRAEAVDMAALLTKLFSSEQVRLAADARSNSLVVFARSDDLMTIEAILSRLDEATEKKADTRPTPVRNQ